MLYLMVLAPYVTDSARLFPHQGQGSHYVVQVPDHRVHVYNQWQKLGEILEAGVIKVGTDGCRHISETTFLQAHILLCTLLSISLLKSLLIRTLTSQNF